MIGSSLTVSDKAIPPRASSARRNSFVHTLQTTEITKAYRGRKVVDNVSVWVKQGEVVGLLGPNGAGKTTSFYMIVGLITPDSGRVMLDDQDITPLAMYQRARQGHQLPAAGSVGVPQAVGGGQPDGDSPDAADSTGASGGSA